MAISYIPNRGDIVYLDFNPTKGHEQRGYRPALIMSPAAYSEKSSLALFCPITSQQKGYPFLLKRYLFAICKINPSPLV